VQSSSSFQQARNDFFGFIATTSIVQPISASTTDDRPHFMSRKFTRVRPRRIIVVARDKGAQSEMV